MKFIILFLLCFFSTTTLFSNDKLRIGVLAFGTVNWELNIMQMNKIAQKYGIDLDIKKLPSKNAVSIALNAGSVDMIVSDFIWVSRQRYKGFDYTFYPYSKSTGGIYVRPEVGLNNILDLEGKTLGIAGGPVNKTWLIARAYSKNRFDQDLTALVKPVFAAPPIINKKMIDNSLDSSINFWHFNAKLQAKGMKKIVDIKDMLSQLGIKHNVPLIGWVFSDKFANKNKAVINNFLQASYETKKLLLTDENQWNKIKKLMRVKDTITFKSLKEGYLDGIPKTFDFKEKESAEKLFEVLAKEGGSKLVGKSKVLQAGTFWDFEPNIRW